MTFRTGTKIGIYEIVGSLGSGGMGEVYRARDANLKREVAIKVLPEALSRDRARVSRLRREAEVLASLNHPHIATIYALGDVESSPFLVLELVEGATLADRIVRGPLSLPESLRIAGQIAEALEAAHDKGIIHRDLKPANVKIDPDGNVKVLDFGIAVIRSDCDGENPTNAPTAMTTGVGTIAGTAAYMSPEQAQGREVGRSTDIWAFGCVLYEMITGDCAFRGSSISEILANVLKTEPDWQRLPPQAAPVRRLLRRCLQKDEKLRFRDIRDVRLEIIDALHDTPESNQVVRVPSHRRERFVWVSIMALAIVAGVFGSRALRRDLTTTSEYRLEINTPPSRFSSLAVSPDGSKIVFTARSGTQSQLWLRSLDSLNARPLPGTENATEPFWSPDGKSIGFFADAKLKRIDVAGGSVRTLLSGAAVPLGGDWNQDGTIIFSDNPGGPVRQVAADGGEAKAATRVEPDQRGHYSPQFLPDGRHFLFYAGSSPAVRGVYVGQLGALESKRLFESQTPAFFAPTGHLIFARDGNLMAQAFDPGKIELKGAPISIVENLAAGTSISVSRSGVIAYRTPPADSGQRQLVWIDRSGKEIDREIYRDSAALGPALSRDGRYIAVYRFENNNMDIWSYEVRRRTWDRLTFEAGDEIYPLWSPDGTSIVYGANRRPGGAIALYRRSVTAPQRGEEELLATPDGQFPTDWSPDGRFILFETFNVKSGNTDILAITVEGDRKPFEVVRTNFNEQMGQFSPDGKWVAYQSDKTGRDEIYLRTFPGSAADILLSDKGGGQVRWNPNGKELFYVAADDLLMAVPLRFVDNKKVEPGTPVPLFLTNIGSTTTTPLFRQQYVVSPNGQSFVMHSAVGDAGSSPITVILNWHADRVK